MLDAFRIFHAFFKRGDINPDDVKIVFTVRDERTKFMLERVIIADPEIKQLTMYAQTAQAGPLDASDFKYHGLHILVKVARG